MIVLFNVKITDVRMGYPYTRGAHMPNPERFDIFKYCLASTSVLEPLVSKFAFYITLAPELEDRQTELDEYIHSLFPADKLHIVWQRNDFGRDWKRNMDELLTDPDEVVWLAANDDHIFIDNSLDIVEAGIKTLKQDQDPNALVYYSHWPEQMWMSKHLNGTLTEDGNFVKFNWETFDGIMMLKAGRLKQYWERDYGDALMFKPDYLGGHHGYECPSTVYAPTKEIVRHYEGYSHTGEGCDNICPPLYIPYGFFEKQMQVKIGYPDRVDNATNLLANAELLFNVSEGGHDHRWCIEDLPLFWKDHIADIDVNLDQNIAMLHYARDGAFVQMTRIPLSCFGIDFAMQDSNSIDYFKKHLLGNW